MATVQKHLMDVLHRVAHAFGVGLKDIKEYIEAELEGKEVASHTAVLQPVVVQVTKVEGKADGTSEPQTEKQAPEQPTPESKPEAQ